MDRCIISKIESGTRCSRMNICMYYECMGKQSTSHPLSSNLCSEAVVDGVYSFNVHACLIAPLHEHLVPIPILDALI